MQRQGWDENIKTNITKETILGTVLGVDNEIELCVPTRQF